MSRLASRDSRPPPLAGAERERPEEPCPFRTPYARDRDRILHTKAFRRLKHKTQVFVAPEGDHYRTRLTHTLEVSALARTVARALGLDEDLVEAIAMGHDLGHAPFGHAGEEALDRELRARTAGECGFAHNLQSVRVVERLERDGAGLNLTTAVRDGIRHHTGPGRPATPEGRILRLMDRVAYVNHDIEDALRAGVLGPAELPAGEIAVLGATTSERLTTLVGDTIAASRGDGTPGELEIAQSHEVGSAFLRLRRFMFRRVYLAPPASVESAKAQGVVSALFRHFVAHPEDLPPPPPEPDSPRESADPLTRVADHVSGMTDRYALRVFRELFTPRERPL